MSTQSSSPGEATSSSSVPAFPEGESALAFIKECLNRLGDPEGNLVKFVSDQFLEDFSDPSNLEPTECLALVLVRSYPICSTTPELALKYEALCETFVKESDDLKFLVIIMLSWDYETNDILHAPAILILLKHAFVKAQTPKLWEFIVDSLLDILESKSTKFTLEEMLNRFFHPLSKCNDVVDRTQRILLSRGVYFCASLLLKNPEITKDSNILVDSLIHLNPNGLNILDWTEETDEDPRNHQYLGRLLSFHEICKVGALPQVYSPLFTLKFLLNAFGPFYVDTPEMNSSNLMSVMMSLLDICCSRIEPASLETDWATFSETDAIFKWLARKTNSNQGLQEFQARALFNAQTKLYSKFKAPAKVFLLMRIYKSAGADGASLRSWVISNLKDVILQDYEVLDEHLVKGFLSEILDVRDTLDQLDCTPEWVAILNCSYCLKKWDSDGLHGMKSMIENKIPNIEKRVRTMISETHVLLQNQSQDQYADPTIAARLESSLYILEIALSR